MPVRLEEHASGAYAKWLHVVALCYCGEHGTDGLVDENAIRLLTRIQELV